MLYSKWLSISDRIRESEPIKHPEILGMFCVYAILDTTETVESNFRRFGTLIDNQWVRFNADAVQLRCSPSQKTTRASTIIHLSSTINK